MIVKIERAAAIALTAAAAKMGTTPEDVVNIVLRDWAERTRPARAAVEWIDQVGIVVNDERVVTPEQVAAAARSMGMTEAAAVAQLRASERLRRDGNHYRVKRSVNGEVRRVYVIPLN